MSLAEARLKDDDYKAVEDALAGRIVDRLKAGGYWGPYYYPIGPYYYPLGPYSDRVAQLKYYHDMVASYEVQNAILGGLYDPSLNALIDAYAKTL